MTDGEFRRAFWHVDFLTAFEGIEATKTNYPVMFQGEGGETAGTATMLAVNGKVRRPGPVMARDFAYLRSVAKKTAKACIPSPTYLHMRGGRSTVSRSAYPDLEEFWADIARAYQEEIRDPFMAGCTYLQIDDVSFACLCDENIRARIKADGEDPGRLPRSTRRWSIRSSKDGPHRYR